MRELTRIVAAGLTVLLLAAPPLNAQARGNGAVVVWTLSGAGGGFGAGLWLGFRAFDGARFAERKISTSAVVGGALGAVAGYLIGRALTRNAAPSAPGRTTTPAP